MKKSIKNQCNKKSLKISVLQDYKAMELNNEFILYKSRKNQIFKVIKIHTIIQLNFMIICMIIAGNKIL